MKKLITYTMTALLATIAISFAAPDDKDAIISKEKAAWQAFKDKKRMSSRSFFLRTLLPYTPTDTQSAAGIGWDVKAEMKSFDLSDFNVVFPNKKMPSLRIRLKSKRPRRQGCLPEPIMLARSGTPLTANGWHLSHRHENGSHRTCPPDKVSSASVAVGTRVLNALAAHIRLARTTTVVDFAARVLF